jgi:hypothetical protein
MWLQVVRPITDSRFIRVKGCSKDLIGNQIIKIAKKVLSNILVGPLKNGAAAIF